MTALSTVGGGDVFSTGLGGAKFFLCWSFWKVLQFLVLSFFMSPLISSVATPPAPTTKSMSTFPQYNGLQKCPWKPGDGLEGCPHRTFGRTSKSSAAGSGNVVNSALELVGSTPMVKLERIMEEFDLPCRGRDPTV